MAVLKDKMNQQDTEIKELTANYKKWEEEAGKLDRQVKALVIEREKMKIRIQKLKKRRNFNMNQKICKNCGQEYLEKENFNWSCRTHRVCLLIA